MIHKKLNPATRADAGRARNTDHAGWLIASENISAHSNFQPLSAVADALVTDLSTRRVAWLARRYQISPTMARAVERHAFFKEAR